MYEDIISVDINKQVLYYAGTELTEKGEGMLTGIDLKEIRLHFKMTQVQFAKAIGISQSAISTWENGICLPDFYTKKKLKKFLESKKMLKPAKAPKQPKQTRIDKNAKDTT